MKYIRSKRQNDKKSSALVEATIKIYDQANRSLVDFINENSHIVDELNSLLEERNDALRKVETILKTNLKNSSESSISCGSFKVLKKGPTFKWDGEKLHDLLPENKTKQFITEVVNYVVDNDRLDSMIRNKEVDAEEVNDALIKLDQSVAFAPGCPKQIQGIKL